MLIGVDGNEANVKKRVGVHQYAYQILWGVYKLRKKGICKHNYVIFLHKKPASDLPKEKSYWKYKVIFGRSFWILTKLMPYLSKDKSLDVFFAPTHYLPPLPLSLPKVCTIHDLGYLRFSEQFKKYDFWQLKLWTAISISISKYIISVSQSTRDDIVRHYPFSSKKVKVVYHGRDSQLFNTKISTNVVRQVSKKYSLPENKNYILFLSTLKPSKNIEGLLTAWSEIKNQVLDTKLVIAGKKGWMYKPIFQKVKDLKLGKSVIFTDYVAENDKPALIRGAKAFVLPSFWEGFGMDIVNAMACGVPVVVSEVASLPEIARDAGVYVDPKSHQSIAFGLKKVINMDKNGYNKLVEKVLSQAKKFSWEKTSLETLKVLEKAKE